MSLRFAIIGAGWYGCHIGLSLAALGFEVKVFEKSSRVLDGASGNNQFRLHLGFHYARHMGTRMQSRDGFARFMERYPTLSAAVPRNLYAVPTMESLIDFATYRVIMSSSGIEFSEVGMDEVGLRHVEGILSTGERVLLTSTARRFFTRALGGDLNLDTPVTSVTPVQGGIRVNGDLFDYVVDATWGHRGTPVLQSVYEPTLLLYYEAPRDTSAVTLVDGPLCSLYPTEDPEIFTLSSVPLTPLGRYASAQEAARRLQSVTSEEVLQKRRAMEEQMSRYMPSFLERTRYLAPQFSVKTKPLAAYDSRACSVSKDDRVFTVMSGKIDTVFFATERILSLIEGEQQLDTEAVRSELRAELSQRGAHS